MRSRTDEIFSVENLRRKWERTEEEADARKAVSEPEFETPEPIREFEKLRELVNRRFPGEQAEALNGLLEELRELLEKRFAESADRAGAVALNPMINEILNQIEDLAEAFSLEGES